MSAAESIRAVPELYITEQDMKRLRDIVDDYGSGTLADAAETLEMELDRAQVVRQDQIPADVVTMHSRVVCEDITLGKQRELTIVYPPEADAEQNKVSILAPLGMALLGQRIGDTFEWTLPHGRKTRLKVIDVRFQPEASGAFDL